MIDAVTSEFLKDVLGVIHVGASRGQEGNVYEENDLDVVWIEPVPEVFEILKSNIQSHPKQHAYQYLVTGEDDKEYEFHISNNRGESSSILELKDSVKLWPYVSYVKTIVLKGITLPTLCKREGIDVSRYNALVLDTQGTELSILKGSKSILDNFKYVKTETFNFEAYKDCCQINDIESFMRQSNYSEIARRSFAFRKGNNHGYDIVYKKNE